MSLLRPFSPAMIEAISAASRKCFGNLPVVPYRTGFKILKRKPLAPVAMRHYLPDMAPGFRTIAPDFRTELEEGRMELLQRLKRRGKAPPKKGQGKRTTRKK